MFSACPLESPTKLLLFEPFDDMAFVDAVWRAEHCLASFGTAVDEFLAAEIDQGGEGESERGTTCSSPHLVDDAVGSVPVSSEMGSDLSQRQHRSRRKYANRRLKKLELEVMGESIEVARMNVKRLTLEDLAALEDRCALLRSMRHSRRRRRLAWALWLGK